MRRPVQTTSSLTPVGRSVVFFSKRRVPPNKKVEAACATKHVKNVRVDGFCTGGSVPRCSALGFGFQVSGVWYRGFGFRFSGFVFRDALLRVSGFRFQVFGIGVSVFDFRVSGLGFCAPLRRRHDSPSSTSPVMVFGVEGLGLRV